KGIKPGGADIDAVLEPFAGSHPADIISAAGVSRGLNVHAFAAAIRAAIVRRLHIMISHALTPVIKIFSLYRARQGPRSSTEGRRRERQARPLKLKPI